MKKSKPAKPANFEDALELLKSVGYTHTNIVLNRQRHSIDIDTAMDSLSRG